MLRKAVVISLTLFTGTLGFSFEQEAYLKASNTVPDDRLALSYFGRSLAISTGTLVVGAPGEDGGAVGVNGDQTDLSVLSAGAAYVFMNDGIAWSQQAYLKASNTRWRSSFDSYPNSFGESVAIATDTIVVGAPGEDSGAKGVNGDGYNTNAINSGAAYVFVRSGTVWTQQAYLKASNGKGSIPFYFMGKFDGYLGDNFGKAVAISGDTVVVGAHSERSNGDPNDGSASGAGAAYVFVRKGTNWSEQAYLKASDPHANALFGASVAISGDTIVVGANMARGAFNTTVTGQAMGGGAAYVFVRHGTNWTQEALLTASNSDRGDLFGQVVSIEGDVIAIGATGEDSASLCVDGNQADNSSRNAGAVYVFERAGTNWTQQAYLKPWRPAALVFGTSLALAGGQLVVGAGKEDVYVFTREQNRWMQHAYLRASNSETGDSFGRSVGISGDKVIVGADGEDSKAKGVNGDQIDNSSGSAGALYAFTGFDFGVSLTPLERWRQQHFGSTANSGLAADLADADHDGLVNLLEYALVTDPTANQVGTNSASVKIRDGVGYLHYQFTRDPLRTNVTIRVETAPELTGPWNTVAMSANGDPTSGAGFVSETDRLDCFKQVEVRDPVSSNAARYRYLRMVIDD